ncbi:MAG: hypothetical protein AAGI03_07850 [Pseudomonadota bacterium]
MSTMTRINNYGTLIAVILSMIAIAVSLLEVSAMRDQQRASVWPYLSIQQTYSGDRFNMTIENKGVGPALIDHVDWRIGGEPVVDLPKVILDTVGPELAFSYDTYRSTNPSNDVMAPGEVVVLFSVPLREDTMAFLSGVDQSLTLNACYCSIHGDCWRASIDQGGAEQVKDCQEGTPPQSRIAQAPRAG